MRVAVFTDNDFEKVNGVTTTLTALLEHRPADILPRIYTASTLGTDAPDYLALPSVAVPIPFYSEMHLYVPRYQQYLRRVLADQINVLHLTTPGPMGLTALWIAAKTGLPLVGSFHTDLAASAAVLSRSKHLAWMMAQYMRWMYGRCSRTLVPSTATRELLIESGVSPDRLVIWSRGVDTHHFNPSRRSSRLRGKWRTSGRELVLLYVGRLSREKGLEILPEMLYRLRALGVPHRMVIAGDGPMRQWLAAQLPDVVFTGMLTRDGVADVFASADLFVFPSGTDTAGNVVLEAQASGLPVVVSGRGGPKEHMKSGITGTVCTESGPREWAHAVADLCNDRARLTEMGRAGREYAVTRSWEMALRSVYHAYRTAQDVAPDTSPMHHAARTRPLSAPRTSGSMSGPAARS